MSPPKNQPKINLLLEKSLALSTTGRILAWILSTFRIIVIVTEIIVMIAFLSRFWLDAKNTDLNEEIALKQDILTASSDFEKKFKDTQKRLKIFSELTANEKLITDSLATINSYLPKDDILLTFISFSEKEAVIEGESSNEKSIQQLIVNLDSTSQFKDIQLQDLKSAKEDPYILEFRLSANLEGGQTQ